MLSAMGTVGAVVVSLWLARDARKTRLYLDCAMTDEEQDQEWVHVIEIKNVGNTSTQIISEGITPFKIKRFHESFMSSTYIGGDSQGYLIGVDSGKKMRIIIDNVKFKKVWKKCYAKFKKKKFYIYVSDHTGRAHYQTIYYTLEDIDEI